MRAGIPLLLACLLTTCAQPDAGPPPVDVVELSVVLTELQLAEALTNELPIIFRDSIREDYYDNVLADHGTTRQEFDSLMWLVRQEPAWVDSLYSRVSDRMAKWQAARE
ncbi:MAG: DUF4296 domain-containing protein [Bacteroidota bacterium]